jgi:hypothetical protein
VRCAAGRLALLVALLWLTVAPLSAQEKTDVAPPPSDRFPAAWYPPDNDVTSTMAPVKGAPYEARIVVQDMSSGLPMEQTPLQERDGAGRMRTETLQMRLGQDGKPITVREVEAVDVVSHCGFHWIEPWVDKSVPTATVSCMPRTLHYNSQPMWASVVSMKAAEEHPSSMETDLNESLGERSFDGVRAVGVRHTQILQPATPENAQTTVTELWVSTEMKELVAMYQDFPGGFRMELRDIKLREPDAGMFYPPANYKIFPVSNHP